jgi:hypothetical protein
MTLSGAAQAPILDSGMTSRRRGSRAASLAMSERWGAAVRPWGRHCVLLASTPLVGSSRLFLPHAHAPPVVLRAIPGMGPAA